GSTAALLLNTAEEGANQLGVEICEVEFAGVFVQLALGKGQQQSKGVSVRGQGVSADLTLRHQSLGEEALQDRRQSRGSVHVEPPQRRSRRIAACCISSGCADR